MSNRNRDAWPGRVFYLVFIKVSIICYDLKRNLLFIGFNLIDLMNFISFPMMVGGLIKYVLIPPRFKARMMKTFMLFYAIYFLSQTDSSRIENVKRDLQDNTTS